MGRTNVFFWISNLLISLEFFQKKNIILFFNQNSSLEICDFCSDVQAYKYIDVIILISDRNKKLSLLFVSHLCIIYAINLNLIPFQRNMIFGWIF